MKGSRWICLIFFAAISASALEVKEVKWGFDGAVVPDRFDVLSVLIENPSMDPFDGTVNLYKSRGIGERVGAIYSTPCYVSPLTARWVQFYVYVENQYDRWRLEWGRDPSEQKEFEPPRLGPPAQVLLSDAETTLSGASAFKQFPEELFPPTEAGTGGLECVLLDHAPRWEAAKRQAFMNWLRAGGQVHLLPDADGNYPVFSDELSVLNFPQERMRIGAGFAMRHAIKARDIRTQDIQPGGVPLRKSKLNETCVPYQTSYSFFTSLAQLSRRHYDWGWIYLLAVVYLGLVGPGNLIAGRKLSNYRLRLVLLLATIGGFACIFNVVGRRGQGEVSVIHTLSYARAIDGDTYDVMQWVNVFARRGANYTIQHNASHNLYSTGQDYESVNGWIENGKGGRFTVDIPMFSRRAFVHEAEMKGASIPVRILNWDGAETLKQLTLSVGPDFTKEVLEGWAVQGNHVYAMKLANGQLEFGNSDAQPLSTFLPKPGYQQQPYMYGASYGNVVTNVNDQFRALVKPLMSWCLRGDDSEHRVMPGQEADRRVQLFLFARSPQSFSVLGSQLGRETGYVLYHLDLFKPGT